MERAWGSVITGEMGINVFANDYIGKNFRTMSRFVSMNLIHSQLKSSINGHTLMVRDGVGEIHVEGGICSV